MRQLRMLQKFFSLLLLLEGHIRDKQNSNKKVNKKKSRIKLSVKR
jgi:hypothetical protein